MRDGDALDRDARERGTSVYFPRRVIPMLPEELSNELCSLKPAVDRLCMVCDMTISADGDIESYHFYPAVMHSRARLTYKQVWDWLSQPKSADEGSASRCCRNSRTCTRCTRCWPRRARAAARSISTRIELELEFDAQGKIETIVPVMRNDAHKLIEECMLAANVCTADYLLEQKQPALYRVHEGPTPEKLAALKEFLAGSALSIGGGESPTPADYANVRDRQRPVQPVPDGCGRRDDAAADVAHVQGHP